MASIKTDEEIGLFNVKTHLSALIQSVQHGKTYVITLRGKPVAQLKPYHDETHSSTAQTLSQLRQVRSSLTGTVDIAELVKSGRKY